MSSSSRTKLALLTVPFYTLALLAFSAICLAISMNAHAQRILPIGPTGAGLSISVTPEKALRRHGISMQKFDYSCGSAALTTLLNQQINMSLSEEDAIEGLLTFGEKDKIIAGRRFSLLDMKRYLASIGISSGGYSAGIEDIPDIPAPAIISIVIKGFKHFVVFQGITEGHIILSDPAFGNMSITLTKFKKLWEQRVFFTIQNPDESEQQSSHTSLSENRLRFVREDIYYHSVLQNDNTVQREITQKNQLRALVGAGVFKPDIR